MKKERMLLTLLFACVLMAFLFGAPIEAQAATSGTCGDNLTWTLDDEGTLTISGTGTMYDYYYNTGYSPWYDARDSVKKAIVEKGVTKIGENAFFSCSAMTSVEIADTVKYIGESAFSASGITDITLPEGLTQIRARLFFECHSLTSIKIPESVTVINNRAFWECTALSNITFPNGLIRIDEYAFGNCTGLTELTIPKANAYGTGVFSGCTNIKTVSFAKDVTYLGGILGGCTGLTSVTIPEGVTTIGGGAFNSCTGLKDVTIPASVTVIEGAAFKNTGLTDITISGKVKKIGDSAFENCTALKSFTAEDGVETIGDRAFEGCTSLASVNLPDSVTTIGFRAFYGCAALKSITLPNGLTKIDEAVFNKCSGLNNIIIPDNVTSIEKEAFAHCTSLTSVVFGESVVVIGNSAFNNCKNLSVLTIPKSIVHVNDNAFKNCSPSCNVNYKGSKDEWQNLVNRGLKQEGNSALLNATFIYDYTGCEHACDAGKVVTPPGTCKELATKIVACLLCDASYTIETAEGTAHVYNGCEDHWCSECSYVRSKAGHTWIQITDSENHWVECVACGEKDGIYAHIPGPEATETTPQTCDYCGYVIVSATNHSHEYSSELTYNRFDHWYACVGCNEKKDVEKHTYANACSTVCVDCGFIRTITSNDTHTYSTKWSADGEYHWHECTACHDVKDGAVHIPGPEATETTPQTCVACGYVITPTQNHSHEFSDTLTFDGANHWYACSGCNEKKDLTEHSFGETWDTDENSHWRVCTCGEKIDKATHTWDGNTCSGCGMINPDAPKGGKKNDAIIIIAACVVGVAAIGGGAAAFVLKKKK